MRKITARYTLFSLSLAALMLLASSSSVLAYGTTLVNDTTGVPSCGNAAPPKPWLYAAKAVGAGSVDLNWVENDNTNSWTLAYGLKSGVYPYGIDRFGDNNSRTIRVSNLPGGTYYFVIRGNNGCMPGPFSNEWKVSVGGGSSTVSVANVPAPKVAEPKPVVSQTPQVKTTPVPTVTKGQQATPTKANVPAVKTSNKATAQQPSFIQSFLNFFKGLFGK